MQWTVLAEVLRALAAGVTAVVATLKFIYDIRHKREQAENELENDEVPPTEPPADGDNANAY